MQAIHRPADIQPPGQPPATREPTMVAFDLVVAVFAIAGALLLSLVR